MALFNFGKKTSAFVLPLHVAALFGAEEGKEMVVEADEAGIAAINAANQELADVQAHIQGLESKAKAAAELAAKVETLEAAASAQAEAVAKKEAEIATLTAQVTELSKEPASNHTTVVKKTDALEGGDTKAGMFDAEIAEEAARIQAAENRLKTFKSLK